MSVKLDHCFISLSNEKINLLEKSQSLVDFEYRKTTRPDMSYEGYYLYFSNYFYFEIVSSDCGIKAGTIGLAFSDLEQNKGSLQRTPQYVETEKTSIYHNDELWFDSFETLNDTTSKFYTWFMEYSNLSLLDRLKSYGNFTFDLQSFEIHGTYSSNQFKEICEKNGHCFSNKSFFNFSEGQNQIKMTYVNKGVLKNLDISDT